MGEAVKPLEIDVELLEQAVRKHFGPEFTVKVGWNVLRNRYLPSATPGRLARPQRVLGFPLWWKAIGEFSSNLGFRLELWDPGSLPAARAMVEEFNRQSAKTRLELTPLFLHWPASGRPEVPILPGV